MGNLETGARRGCHGSIRFTNKWRRSIMARVSLMADRNQASQCPYCLSSETELVDDAQQYLCWSCGAQWFSDGRIIWHPADMEDANGQ